MHYIMTASYIIAFFIFGNFKDLKNYEETIMYVVIVNLAYLYLCANFWMWQYKPHIFSNQFMTDMCYTFIVMPICAYLFLKYAPSIKSIKNVLVHIFRWSILFFFTEWIYLEYGAIIYDHGWNLFWSAIFYVFMFPLMYLHHHNRVWAYIISLIFITFLINYFDVPIFIPIEKR